MIAKVKSRRSIMRKGITCRKSVLPYVHNAVRRGMQAKRSICQVFMGYIICVTIRALNTQHNLLSRSVLFHSISESF